MSDCNNFLTMASVCTDKRGGRPRGQRRTHGVFYHSVHIPRLYQAPRRVRRNVEGIQDIGWVQMLKQLAACLVSFQSYRTQIERYRFGAIRSLVGAYNRSALLPYSADRMNYSLKHSCLCIGIIGLLHFTQILFCAHTGFSINICAFRSMPDP